MTSRSNSFRESGIPGGITPDNTSTPSSPVPHISTVLTVNGKGRPSGLSNSPWGSKFRDRRDFFERISCADEEEFSTGDEDEPRPLYDVSRCSMSSLVSVNVHVTIFKFYIWIYVLIVHVPLERNNTIYMYMYM